MSLKIGYTTDDKALLGRRDAFHAPAVLVQCDKRVKPKDYIKFISKDIVELSTQENSHGIVDPFVPAKYIPQGLYFWVLLNPESTSNLTHNFTLNFLQENGENKENERIAQLEEELETKEEELTELTKFKNRIEASEDDEESYNSCRGCY